MIEPLTGDYSLKISVLTGSKEASGSGRYLSEQSYSTDENFFH
jgi:hypothetical protein